MFAEQLRPAQRVWQHDRSLSVGASEIGACARQTWFIKRGHLPERELPWGYGERGHHVEQWVYGALRRAKIRLYRRQCTISKGLLSATLDAVCPPVVIEIKSYDPYKKNVVESKHIWQVQVQIGLWNDTYRRSRLERGVLLYVNASDFQDLREHVVEPNPEAYAAAQVRAEDILTSIEPPPREGVLAGGRECLWCPFQTACLGAPLATGLGKLSEAETAGIAEARAVVKAAEVEVARNERRIALAKEAIREILRGADARRAPGLARISRSQRTTLDQDALERSGVDLTPFRKPGRETETVTVE